MSINPFRLWGSWVGLFIAIVVLVGVLWISSLMFGPLKMFSCNGNIPGDCLRFALGLLCFIIAGFLAGWILHMLLMRKSKGRLVSMFFISAIVSMAFQCSSVSAITNPAAAYCQELGYKFEDNTTQNGQVGICVVNDTVSFNAWDFFEGLVGKEFSYCSKQGFETLSLTDGKNPYSPTYAVCKLTKVASAMQARMTNSSNPVTNSSANSSNSYELVSVSDLMNLKERVRTDTVPDLQGASNSNIEKSMAAAPATSVPLPSSFDWGNKEGHSWLTSAKDQGVCGSCWAFASVGAVEANIKIWTNNWAANPDLSEEYLVSDCSKAGNCQGGSPYSALQFVRDSGIPDESCMPYVDGGWLDTFGGCPYNPNGPCSSSCTYHTNNACSDATCSDRCSNWQSRTVKINEFGSVGSDPQIIKRYLVEKGPLVAVMAVDGSWWGDLNTYRCGSNQLVDWHVVDIVGYNDAGQYWIIKNSWGWLGNWLGTGSKVGYGECGLGSSGVYWVAVDTDGDGVPDYRDACPATPGSCNGCPLPSCNSGYSAVCPSSGIPYCNPIPTCVDPTTLTSPITSSVKLCSNTYNSVHLRIIGSDLTVDCNHATLVGNGQDDVIDILRSRNIIVTNCKITGATEGVLTNDVNNSQFINNEFYQNIWQGILVMGGKNNQISNNYFHANNRGVDLSSSNNNTVSNNNFTSNVNAYNASIWIYNGAKGNQIFSNNFYGQGTYDTNQLQNVYCVNGISNNYYSGAKGPSCNCTSNWVLSTTWSPCDTKNTSYSEWFDLNSCNTTIRRYKADCDYCKPNVTNTSWSALRNQTKCGVGNSQIQNSSRTEYDKNYGACYSVTKLPSDLWNNGKNKTYWHYSNVTCHHQTSCVVPSDGMVITRNTTFCRGTYLIPNGITVGNSNVMLDCNRSTLIGSNLSNGLTLSNVNNIQVRNCVIKNYHGGAWSSGINIGTVNNSVFANNVLQGNSQGLIFGVSYNNLVVNNSISSSQSGIFLDSSSWNRILTNNIFNVTFSGVFVGFNSNHNIVQDNNIQRSSWYGLSMQSTAKHNIVKHNNLSNSNYGIMLHSGNNTYNAFVANLIYNNNNGVELEDASANHNNFTQNRLQGQAYDSFVVNGQNNYIWNNSIYDNPIVDSNVTQNVYCVHGVGNQYYSGATGPGCGCNDGSTKVTTCGVGACSATGIETCTAGVWGGNTCTPKAPGVETCNGVDDDCDGFVDEGLTRVTTCGVGACASTGIETCSAGVWGGNTCVPKSTGVETCNGVDDDCDGNVDEGLTRVTTCGAGPCVATGIETCTAGVWGGNTCHALCTKNYSVYSPKSGNFSYRNVRFNISILKVVPYLKYTDYGVLRPSARVLCTKCSQYGFTRKQEIGFDDGYHKVNIFSTDKLVNETISFFIDSTKPVVISQGPANKAFCNGSFVVKYTEQYPLSVNLHYANQVMSKQDCPKGNSKTCNFFVSLGAYENQNIDFYFDVKDTFNTVAFKKSYTCLVDTIPPHILSLISRQDKNYLYLNISLDQKAKYLKYVDYGPKRPVQGTLCSNCNEFGRTRVQEKYFGRGFHNITISAEDAAGNTETKAIKPFSV